MISMENIYIEISFSWEYFLSLFGTNTKVIYHFLNEYSKLSVSGAWFKVKRTIIRSMGEKNLKTDGLRFDLMRS